MHIADPESGNLGANAIVGGSAGIATGAAFASQRLGLNRVAVCFFGEGALGQGLLYETMNLAALWQLPVIYVCENNLYNEYTHFSETTAGKLQARAEAFGIQTQQVDGQEIMEVHAAAQEMVNRARSGAGPSFLHCQTYRFHGHHVGDIDRTYYRSRDEESTWRKSRDPIQKLSAHLQETHRVSDEILNEIGNNVQEEIVHAVQFALDAPFPNAAEVDEHVYV